MQAISFFRLSILDRYLIRDLYKTFIGVLLVLVLILFANNLVFALDKIISGKVSRDVLWQLMQFEIFEMLSLIMPPAFYFGILVSLGRLYRDSEMIAMQMSGISNLAIYRTYLIGSIPVVLLVGMISFYVMPWAKQSIEIIQMDSRTKDSRITALETGRFQEFKGGEIVFFAASAGANKGEIRDVFIQNNRGEQPAIITAKEGYQLYDPENKGQYMVLKDGYRYLGQPGLNTFSVSKFYEYGIRIRTVDNESGELKLPAKARPFSQIWGSDQFDNRAEMQFRFAIPLSVLALTFVAVPLSRSMPRQGIYGRLFVAFVVYFLIMNLMKLADKWMDKGETPIWLGMWWVPLLIASVAILIEFYDRFAYLFTVERLKANLVRR